jgi:hypothetical protein
MTVDIQIDQALQEAFCAAVVLTGSAEAAEFAVTDAIASLESDLTRETLLRETAESAIRQRQNILTTSGTTVRMPLELRAFFAVSHVARLLRAPGNRTSCEWWFAEGLRLALAGIAIGMVGSLGLTRVFSSLSHLLYGVRASDPITLISVSLLLIGGRHSLFYPGAARGEFGTNRRASSRASRAPWVF